MFVLYCVKSSILWPSLAVYEWHFVRESFFRVAFCRYTIAPVTCVTCVSVPVNGRRCSCLHPLFAMRIRRQLRICAYGTSVL